MGILSQTREAFVRWQYANHAQHLSTVDPNRVQRVSEVRVVAAFKRAAKLCPAYARMLREMGVDPKRINTIENFKRFVPVLDKKSVFSNGPLKEYCINGGFRKDNFFWSSSGQSKTFSFATESRKDFTRTAYDFEFLLNDRFRIQQRKTLLINCLPMGVKIPTRTIAVADTSVRSDAALALISKLAEDFDQIIIVGESLFIKKLLEEGKEAGIDWHKLTVHIITGAEFISEQWRCYIMHILGIETPSIERGLVGINMGISELSTVVFTDCLETIKLRQLLHQEKSYLAPLLGYKPTYCPQILQYFPSNTYIETIPGKDGEHEIVVSMLSPSASIPLIRYNTKDLGETLSYDRLKRVLGQIGCENLLPQFHLPLGIIWGRKQSIALEDGRALHVNQVKEAIYADYAVAACLTGNFHLETSATGNKVLFQSKPKLTPNPAIGQALRQHIHAICGSEICAEILPYHDFPYGMELDYERKVAYC